MAQIETISQIVDTGNSQPPLDRDQGIPCVSLTEKERNWRKLDDSVWVDLAQAVSAQVHYLDRPIPKEEVKTM